MVVKYYHIILSQQRAELRQLILYFIMADPAVIY